MKSRGDDWVMPCKADSLRGVSFDYDLKNAATGEVLVEAGNKITGRIARQLKDNKIEKLSFPTEALITKFLANDLVNPKTGELIALAGSQITKGILAQITELNIKKLDLLDIDYVNTGPYIRNTLMADKCDNREDALKEIYRVMRPGDPPTLETAEVLFKQMFFESERYDLSPVGRVNINRKLALNLPDDTTVLTNEDIIAIVKNAG